MSRSFLSQLQRTSYLVSRTAGDARAAQRGPTVLVERLVRRSLTRRAFAALNRNRTTR